MGIIIHQNFPFPNMPPAKESYLCVGFSEVKMHLGFDAHGNRLYTITVPYSHYVNINALYQRLQPVYTSTSVLTANTVVMENLSKFTMDSFKAGLAAKGITDFEDDGIVN